jgi:hypothetical protein
MRRNPAIDAAVETLAVPVRERCVLIGSVHGAEAAR